MQHKSAPLTPETPDGQTLNRFAKFSVVQTGERSERGTPRYKVYGHYANGQMVWIDSLYLHDQAITDAWQRAEDADTLRQQNGDVGIVADPSVPVSPLLSQPSPSDEPGITAAQLRIWAGMQRTVAEGRDRAADTHEKAERFSERNRCRTQASDADIHARRFEQAAFALEAQAQQIQTLTRELLEVGTQLRETQARLDVQREYSTRQLGRERT